MGKEGPGQKYRRGITLTDASVRRALTERRVGSEFASTAFDPTESLS
jgi:hypothetical protein